MWPCEGPPSSPTPRQNWRLTNETFLEMVDHTQKDNKWKQYCVGESNDPNLKTLSLVSCQWGREHAGAATGKFAFDGGKLRETNSGTCLGYASDLRVDGAPLALGDCGTAPSFTMAHGSIMADGRCVTAGWPFFQGAAFERPDGAVAVVVVNEAGSAAQFELEVDGGVRELCGEGDPGEVVLRGAQLLHDGLAVERSQEDLLLPWAHMHSRSQQGHRGCSSP